MMMEADKFSEMLGFCSELTRHVSREGFFELYLCCLPIQYILITIFSFKCEHKGTQKYGHNNICIFMISLPSLSNTGRDIFSTYGTLCIEMYELV
jgi:hypothetical protein